MKGKSISVLAASLLASLPAVAAINPASPGLPTVTAAAAPGATYSANVPNNQMSSMCVDCHTRAPKPSMGTHYVGVVANDTNSGGTGVNATGTLIARDNGAYFKTSLWNANNSNGAANYSKYGNGTTSFVPAVVAGSGTATAQATLATYATYEIICESCHNIVQNEIGGNNLLEHQSTAGNAVNDYESAITASMMCVGCHGFMYTPNAANSGNANYADARNTSEITGALRGNNEYHSAYNGTAQAPYAQNHHTMTGDNVNAALAAAGVLWTDNLIVSYTDAPISNTSTLGGFPVGAAWTGVGIQKPANGGLVCTSCHAPGHGGGLDEGASILRNADSTANADAGRTNAWNRILETAGGGGWKNIKDLQFCGQCHKN